MTHLVSKGAAKMAPHPGPDVRIVRIGAFRWLIAGDDAAQLCAKELLNDIPSLLFGRRNAPNFEDAASVFEERRSEVAHQNEALGAGPVHALFGHQQDKVRWHGVPVALV